MWTHVIVHQQYKNMYNLQKQFIFLFRPLNGQISRQLKQQQQHGKLNLIKNVSSKVPNDREKVKEDKSDQFGTLASQPSILNSEYLSDDDDGYDVLEKVKRRRSLEYYENEFVKLRYRGGHNRAKEIYAKWIEMRKDARVDRPRKNLYSLIITTMAQSGLTDKAFLLFKEFLDDNRTPTQSMITSLFNACAESFDKKEGLSYANYLRDWIYESGYTCNLTHYNAMIKAFSRNGDLKTSFEILNEMKSHGQKPDGFTYNMLLMGAISDKETGFSHAIRILRERLKHFPLNESSLRLFLKSASECKFGSIDHLANLLEISETQKLRNSVKGKSISGLMLEASKFNLLTTSIIEDASQLLPLLNIHSLDKPHERLALIGGLDGVIGLIEKYNIEITPPLCLEIIDTLPPTIEDEEKFLAYLKNNNVNVAVSLFNSLIKRRAFRMCEKKDIDKALIDMNSFHLHPDIVTFGCIALTCRTSLEIRQFINDLSNAGMRPNSPIMHSLISATLHLNYWQPPFKLLKYLLILLKRNSLPLTPKMLEKITQSMSYTEKLLLEHERGLSTVNVRNTLEQEYEDFKKFFIEITKKLNVDIPVHEREQFDFEIVGSKKEKYNQFVKDITKLKNSPLKLEKD